MESLAKKKKKKKQKEKGDAARRAGRELGGERGGACAEGAGRGQGKGRRRRKGKEKSNKIEFHIVSALFCYSHPPPHIYNCPLDMTSHMNQSIQAQRILPAIIMAVARHVCVCEGWSAASTHRQVCELDSPTGFCRYYHVTEYN